MNLKLIKLPTLPNLPKLPKIPNFKFPSFKLEALWNVLGFIKRHKLIIISIILLVAFIWGSLVLRSYLLSKMKITSNSTNDNGDFYTSTQNNPIPTTELPSPTIVPNNSASSNNYYNFATPTPFPTFAPLPTLTPIPTLPPITTTTTTSSSSNSTGNSNCTTGSGTPNSWYSDVYPNPPITTGTGSITLLVYIRDCYQKNAPVSDNLTITLTSSDSTARINGQTSPVKIQTQNGYASFTVSSTQNITDTFTVHDDTSNFTVTDVTNHNPSVTFSGNGSNNTNCTTASGTPNFWYSEVYPPSSTTINTGSSANFTVTIRDCSKTAVSNDKLTITQTSSDSSFTINGSSSPVTIQASNGQASFSVSSSNAGTDTFTVHDDTSNFTVTTPSNNNPNITFTASSATPSPTPTSAPAATPTLTPTSSPTPTASSSGN